jgi:NitT/TauT family transport system substrate-binding protein/sulfonate transport system substrate-binding protein
LGFLVLVLAGGALLLRQGGRELNAAPSTTVLNFGFPWNGGVGSTATMTGPIGYAIHLGIAEPLAQKHGFTLGKQVGFNTGQLALAALQSGDIQLSDSGETPAVLTAVNGQGTRAVIVTAPNSDLWLISRRDQIGSVQDLAGKSIGAPFGSTFDKFALALLDRKGLAGKVKLVNLAPSETYAGLRSGGVAAVVAPPTQASGWLRQDPDLIVIGRAREGRPELERSANVLSTTETFAKAHPALQPAMWDIYKAGADAIRADPERYYRFFADRTGLSVEAARDIALLQFADEPISPDGLKVIVNALAFLRKSGVVKGPELDLNTWILGPHG